MGFIILGIILAVGLFILSIRTADYDFSQLFIMFAIGVVLAGFVSGLFFVTGGYKPVQEIQTVELQALSDQTTSTGNGRMFYVSINASNAYTYYTEVESEFAGNHAKAYVSRTISGDNITVVEEENCQSPRLTEYKQDPRITFWSFALDHQKKYYVFYVPEGTIAHEIALGQ